MDRSRVLQSFSMYLLVSPGHQEAAQPFRDALRAEGFSVYEELVGEHHEALTSIDRKALHRCGACVVLLAGTVTPRMQRILDRYRREQERDPTKILLPIELAPGTIPAMLLDVKRMSLVEMSPGQAIAEMVRILDFACATANRQARRAMLTRRSLLAGVGAAVLASFGIGAYARFHSQTNEHTPGGSGSDDLLATLQGHTSAINRVSWSPDSRYLLSASNDTTALVWNMATRQVQTRYTGHRGEVVAAAWSPNGRMVVTADTEPSLHIWEPLSGTVIHMVSLMDATSTDATWAPESDRVATGHLGGEVRIWDPGTGQPLLVDNIGFPIFGLAWAPNGTFLAAGLWGTLLVEWEAALPLNHVSQLTPPAGSIVANSLGTVTAVAWSSDSERLATSNSVSTGNAPAVVWDGRTLAPLFQLLPQSQPTGAVFDVSWAPDGQQIVIADSTGAVEVLDATSGQFVADYRGHRGEVLTAKWSPNGQAIASAGVDTVVRIWRAPKGMADTSMALW